jgi:hypothetical protein
MTNFEQDNGTTRDDLVQRLALMEIMIAEGRKSTARFGWIFVMWGVLYFAAVGWTIYLPFAGWAWPVCIAAGVATILVVKSRQRRADGLGENQRSRSIDAVWRVMGAAITLYVIAAVLSHHAGSPAYAAAILTFIGMAHATSAIILRWTAQGLAAAVWWVCAIAMFFVTTSEQAIGIFLVAAFFGMILFGLYAMWLERKRVAGARQDQVQHHA